MPATSTKEKSIPLSILPHPVRIILPRIKLLPHTRGEDMLVPLVPPSIHDFREIRVIIDAFQITICGRHLTGVI